MRERFVAELARRAERIRLGRGTEEGVECGPLVSAQQRAKTEDYVASALAEGAELRCGGKRPESSPSGPSPATSTSRPSSTTATVRCGWYGRRSSDRSSPSKPSAPRTRP